MNATLDPTMNSTWSSKRPGPELMSKPMWLQQWDSLRQGWWSWAAWLLCVWWECGNLGMGTWLINQCLMERHYDCKHWQQLVLYSLGTSIHFGTSCFFCWQSQYCYLVWKDLDFHLVLGWMLSSPGWLSWTFLKKKAAVTQNVWPVLSRLAAWRFCILAEPLWMSCE